MAIDAQILPVAAVRRIVVVVVILVMHGQQVEILCREFPAATRAYPRVNSERLLSVPFQSLFFIPARLGHNSIHLLRVDLRSTLFL
jgi:hypothetical protein